MKRSLTLLLILAFAGCGGGGGSADSGGIGGSGITRGVVTDVGSATVAGTNYTTDGAEFEFDRVVGTLADLEVGMKVTVNGTRAAGGAEGAASRVEFDDDIEGPISEILELTPDRRELTIFGQTVVIERDATIFAGGIDFDSVDLGDVVEVSGLRGAAGIDATRVLRKTTLAMNPTPPVELKGEVSDLMVDEFMIGPVTVLFDVLTTDLTDVPGGVLAEGDFVEVEGVLDAMGQVDADAGRIEIEELAISGDLPDFEIEGIVSDFTSLVSFQVEGQPVDAGGFGVLFEPNDPSFIRNGATVEVEGRLQGGILVAAEVKLREGEARIEAEIADAADVDLVAGTITLLGEIVVEVLPGTRLDDFTDLSQLGAGDFVEVRGVSVFGVVRATRVKLEGSSDDVRLEGRVSGFDINTVPKTFTILDVDVPTDASTDFDDIPGVDDEDAFYSYLGALIAGGAAPILEVKDEQDGDDTAIDFADEVEPVDEADEARVSAEIAANGDIDQVAELLTLLGVDISFAGLDPLDDFEDCGAINGIEDLAAGDYLEVDGVRLPGGLVQATKVKCDTTGDVELLGRVEAFDSGAGTFNVLGVVVPTAPGTNFASFPGVSTEAEFYSFLMVNPTAVLGVTDDQSDGDATTLDLADEVEFEDDGD